MQISNYLESFGIGFTIHQSKSALAPHMAIAERARAIRVERPSQSHARTFIAAEHPSQLRCGQPIEQESKLAGGWGRMRRFAPHAGVAAGQYMKLGTTKPCPRITVWRTVKSAGNRWTRGTARTFGTTNSSRCQTAGMFERGRALTSTIGGRQPSPRSNPHEASTDIRRRLRTPWTQPLRLAQSFPHH
jgi:hypothetical protein